MKIQALKNLSSSSIKTLSEALKTQAQKSRDSELSNLKERVEGLAKALKYHQERDIEIELLSENLEEVKSSFDFETLRENIQEVNYQSEVNYEGLRDDLRELEERLENLDRTEEIEELVYSQLERVNEDLDLSDYQDSLDLEGLAQALKDYSEYFDLSPQLEVFESEISRLSDQLTELFQSSGSEIDYLRDLTQNQGSELEAFKIKTEEELEELTQNKDIGLHILGDEIEALQIENRDLEKRLKELEDRLHDLDFETHFRFCDLEVALDFLRLGPMRRKLRSLARKTRAFFNRSER